LHHIRDPHNRNPETVVSLLINKGVDINQMDNMGNTPLHEILWKTLGQNTLTELFIRYRAKPSGPDEKRVLKEYRMKAYQLWIRGRWGLLKPCVKLLSLHARAVITANHPLRKLARNEFEEE